MGTFVNYSLLGWNLWFSLFHFLVLSWAFLLSPCMQQRWESQKGYSRERSTMNSTCLFPGMASLDGAVGLHSANDKVGQGCAQAHKACLASFMPLPLALQQWQLALTYIWVAWGACQNTDRGKEVNSKVTDSVILGLGSRIGISYPYNGILHGRKMNEVLRHTTI